METVTAGLSVLRELIQTMPRLGGFVVVCVVLIVLIVLMVRFGLLIPSDQDDDTVEEASQKTRDEILSISRKDYDLNNRILAEIVKSNRLNEQILDEMQNLREHIVVMLSRT